MAFQIPQKFKSTFGSLVLAAVLLLAIIWGAGSGQRLAQAAAIVQSARQAQQALKYFYGDQNRYPTASEFADQNTMLNYLTSFPLPEYPSASCPQTFDYKRPADNAYSLSFCLPSATNGYSQGWNTVGASAGQ